MSAAASWVIFLWCLILLTSWLVVGVPVSFGPAPFVFVRSWMKVCVCVFVSMDFLL